LLVHGTEKPSRLTDPFSDVCRVVEYRHEASSQVLELEAEGHKKRSSSIPTYQQAMIPVQALESEWPPFFEPY
jgi:hypothetical protein